MPFVPVQILTIVDNLPIDVNINYFLLYDTQINKESKLKNIDYIRKFSSLYKNVNFTDIDVGDIELFAYLARDGGNWSYAAYFPLVAHKLLPINVDRVLYLDAGDVFVQRDFREYYFTDFSDNFLIVTPARYKAINNELKIYEGEDLYDLSLINGITRGVFNSGSYIMNLNLMRSMNFNEKTYMAFAERLTKMQADVTSKEHDFTYWGDQGFLSALFLGKIKYYGYPDIRNIWYMPFNFCLWYYDRMDMSPWYAPCIIHFAGVPKPWTIKYPYDTNLLTAFEASQQISDLKSGQREYYYTWHEYAIKADMIRKQ